MSVPGLMALGLSVPATSRNKAFKYEVDLNNNVVAFEKNSRAVAAEPAPSVTSAPGSRTSRLQRALEAPFVPAKFALAGQKLTFKGYFMESIPENAIEAVRQRHLVLQYHLEDDSLSITDLNVRNDGIMHGPFLKRMKVAEIGIDSLRVGQNVEVFAKNIRVYACDEFTRKFYDGLGSAQPGDEPPAPDDWSVDQAKKFARNDPSAYHGVKSSAITRFIEADRGKAMTSFKKDVKGRFLEYDGLVFKFYIMWLDKYADPPTKYFYWLSYFMATEECEIREAKGKKDNIGWSTLLSRTRLPKMTLITDDRMRSVEDGTGDEDYYHEGDLLVGSPLRVFGRDMVILDCDEMTAKWYKAHKGVDQKAKRIVVSVPEVVKKPIQVPPHSGIGSEEDTLASWKHLIPRKPKIDFSKFRARTGKTSKWMAKFVTDDPINSERVFRFTYFHDDDDLAVFEPPIRNSGVAAGVFQKKKKMKNVATGKDFRVADFIVGTELVLKGHRFLIVAEEAQPVVTIPEVGVVVLQLKRKLLDASNSLRKMFRKFDLDKSQTMSFDEFMNMLNYYSLGLTKYETIVLFKSFEDQPGFMSYENFMRAFDQANEGVGAAQLESAGTEQANLTLEDLDALIEEARMHARREEASAAAEMLLARLARALKNNKGASTMHENFRRFDENKDHMISPVEFRQVMGSGGLHLSKDEVEMLVEKFYFEDDGTELAALDYMQFMHTLHVYADKVLRS